MLTHSLHNSRLSMYHPLPMGGTVPNKSGRFITLYNNINNYIINQAYWSVLSPHTRTNGSFHINMLFIV